MIKRTKEDKINLLNETLNFYLKNERAVNDGGACFYSHITATFENQCAVGRCLKNPDDFEKEVNKLVKTGELDGSGIQEIIQYHQYYGKDTQKLFKSSYQGFSVGFWTEVQVFHDSENFWEISKELGNMNKLSKEGKIYYDNIIKKIERDDI